jgi:NAD(P)-dependent dehydrogenase (short-subunit alcohol dehydrogenase family)
MRGLKDKVVIVSGGATLIGAAIARAFVAEGRRWSSPTSTAPAA